MKSSTATSTVLVLAGGGASAQCRWACCARSLLAAQLKRFVAVEEVAALAAVLCSEQAGSITGALLPLDGGRTAQ